MIVNFEFFDEEPIENVITSLNYKIDKTVFFGYDDVIKRNGNTIAEFLSKYCENETAEFLVVPRGKLQKTLGIMREAVQKEKDAGNKVFFDVTGGEPLPLIAFGILATETETPMHMFNVSTGNLKEIDEGAREEISKEVPQRAVDLTIDMLLELRGGSVKTVSQKSNKKLADEKNLRDVDKLIKIFERHLNRWCATAKAFRECLISDGAGIYHVDYGKMRDYYDKRLVGEVKSLVAECAESKLLEMFTNEEHEERFAFVSDFVRDVLREEGAILELRTCLEYRKTCRHALAGVHIDWNGIINESIDVVNEVDVIALDGYVPYIISCKCGNNAKAEALYELDTVARKVGGKYAHKVLVSAKNMTLTDKKRAREMGIEVRILNETLRID